MENSEFDTAWIVRNDPVLAVASKTEAIPREWVRILLLNKKTWDTITARRSYEVFRQAAEKGSLFAMCACHDFALNGWGRTQSNDDAYMWAQKAASAGFVPAYFLVGQCYENGIGVAADLERARHYYDVAIKGKFGQAATHLASMYSSGKFGKRDMFKALEYAASGYELGDHTAALLIGGWYEAGDGVIRNVREAVKWYERAAALGDFLASMRLSRAYEEGDLGLPKDVALARKYEDMFDTQSAVPSNRPTHDS